MVDYIRDHLEAITGTSSILKKKRKDQILCYKKVEKTHDKSL
jgi:hypothetical protein